MTDNPFGSPGTEAADDDDFAVDIPEGDDGYCIPANTYPAYVCELEKAYSEAGNPMWVWWFRINGGEYKNRKFPVYTALTPAAMWKVRETLVALGLGEGGQSVKFKKADAIGRTCSIIVEDDEYRGQKRSTISRIEPRQGDTPERVSVTADDDVPF